MDADLPYPKNAPGPFFVRNEECITCGAPEAVAPDLMAFDETPHCYFRRQPGTRFEVERAIRAVRVACCYAVRYSGSDPSIIARIEETEEARRARWLREYGSTDTLPDHDPDA